MSISSRSWMYNKNALLKRGLTREYIDGVEEFISFASAQTQLLDRGKIRCPCGKCKNMHFVDVDDLRLHLYTEGFIENYYIWYCHGEVLSPSYFPQTVGTSRVVPESVSAWGNYENMTWDQRVVYDAMAPSGFPESSHVNDVPSSSSYEHTNDVNNLSDRFLEVLNAADKPLYSECDGTSTLAAVAEILSIKSDWNLPESCMSRWLQSVGGWLPRDHNLPTDFYSLKKMISELGLPVVKIDACPAGCMLFWKNDEELDTCKFCGESRYKPVNERRGKRGKRRAKSKLIYLPFIQRLQRLYASHVTAKHMTWHVEHETEAGLMCHPSDSEAWKHFDRCHPYFACEPRNVRIGLCTDGFAPHGQFGTQYSCWPVMITPYNLPPDMCMRSEFLFLTLICPGPNNPKKRLDVYMQPVIEDLRRSWYDGIPTYDVSRDQVFNMKVALIWTISDFPAYGMLSGWSTAGLKGCPICMEWSKSFYLQHGRKPCYFDCHRRFLPHNHPYRKDKKSFRKGVVERDPPPPLLDGSQIYERFRGFDTAVENPLTDPIGYGTDHKWTKRSILWDLPYWKDLLIRHNLDVMHIEKNVFDNIFNTVMNFPNKTKDGLNSRKDVWLHCDRPEIAVAPESDGPVVKAIYQLSTEQKKKILEWIRSLRFPDGYTSNLANCVDMTNLKMRHLKSHDCHVIMQRLLPIALKDMVPESVWNCITEVSHLFQCICSTVLNTDGLEDLERNVSVMMCNLEKMFPPSFFDSMEHLLIHLPYETKVAGPVFYRWMYCFERKLGELKKKVTNKAHIEASICQAYITEEIATFASYYFDSDVIPRRKRPARNDDVGDGSDSFSIFNYPGRGYGKHATRYITGDLYRIAHTYILVNCPEVEPFYREFRESLYTYSQEEVDRYVDSKFAEWFRQKITTEAAGTYSSFLESLAWGPSSHVKTYPGYFVNGFSYHTLSYGEGRNPMNSGICVPTCSYDNSETNFYGTIDDILEFTFAGPKEFKAVLFQCSWIDPIVGVRKHPRFNIVDVNVSKIYRKNESFILAQQGAQVYYAKYPSTRQRASPWMCACSIRPRKIITHATPREVDLEAFQQEFFQPPPIVETTQVGLFLQDMNGGEIVALEGENEFEENEWISGEDTEEDEIYIDDDYESD